MQVELEPKSVIAFNTEACEVLYGGAAGGMKSFTLRTSAIRWCAEIPGVQVYFFRRTLPDLRDNHLRGPTSFFVLLADYIQTKNVQYHAQENEFAFWNGAILHLCYCDSENDVEKYRGAEIHVLMIDELTHFSEYQYRFLRSRVRRAGLKIPDKYKDRLPRIETASNPGSIGHAWVKRTWITPKPPFEIWKASPDEGGMKRQFIPAKLSENIHLAKEDPEYENRLKGLGAASLVKAMLEGDWNIVAGMAFEKLSRSTHCIEPFTPPEDWLIFGSFDWGSTRPFSYGLWTVSNGDSLPDGRVYQRGAIIRYDELYGWNGKPNEGLRMEVREVANEIKKLENGVKPAYRIADSAIWDVDGGPSIGEGFNKHGVVMRPAPKGKGSRHNGYIEVRQRIEGNTEGPMLYATSICHNGFWRTMPDMVMDEHLHGIQSEDVDTDQEDHCFAGHTKVITADGIRRIDQCDSAEILLTSEGWEWGFPTPERIAICVKLTFDDGSEIVCTPDHKFLTQNGWIEATDLLDEISYNILWSRSYLRHAKSFWAFVTGSAVYISSAKVVGSIGLFGKQRTEKFLQGVMSIISTETDRIINSSIFNWSFSRNISVTTQNNPTILHGSNPCEKALGNGMAARLEGNGILNTQKDTWLGFWRKRSKSYVNFAGMLTWPQRFLLRVASFVIPIARQKRCVAVEPFGKTEVFCFHVPSAHNFALWDGTIVHNCYDEVRYACTSRPWQRNIEKKKEPIDRWFKIEEKAEDSWRTL